MPFYAKPSGGYAISSTEGTANIEACYDYLNPSGYVKDAVSGMLGNVSHESGLNPWRWQSDQVSLTDPYKGYGLMQFTPAYQYINLTGIPDHAPNTSTSSQTAGASPDDAKGQLYVFIHDTLGKWYPYLWRTYWRSSKYPALYQQAQNILNTYGNGTTLTQSQFATISNYQDACLAFLGCYEGPAESDNNPLDANYNTRVQAAYQVKLILDQYQPGPGPGPGPGPTPPDPGPGFDLDDILFVKKFFIDKSRNLW